MKNLLEIREISYGEFPEISDLNPRFKPESKKVKATLDIQLPQNPSWVDLSSVIHQLMELLPTLAKHQCGESLFDNLKTCGEESSAAPNSSFCFYHPDKITDLAHLMEHMIIDLQSNITGMDSCSGITCGYKNPPYRFDMFIECSDQAVGLFSVLFTRDVFAQLLERGKVTKRYHCLIDLAKYLYQHQAQQNSAGVATATNHIAKEMGLKKIYVEVLIQRLKELGFFDDCQF